MCQLVAEIIRAEAAAACKHPGYTYKCRICGKRTNKPLPWSAVPGDRKNDASCVCSDKCAKRNN
jgi:hypothetical protein